MKKVTYLDIYDFDIKLIDMISKEYKSELAWSLFKTFYVDPDSYEIKFFSDNSKILCSADALLSINRIKKHEKGFGKDFKNTFVEYRKKPIFFFPSERLGINVERNKIFKDRIDHTLFDLKNRLDGNENTKNTCKLIQAYEKPKTKKWLEEVKTFRNYVDWLGLIDIFTDKDYNIYDLEYDDGTIITTYSEDYKSQWSENYYKNVKDKINKYFSSKF